jgi:hypothetical protein
MSKVKSMARAAPFSTASTAAATLRPDGRVTLAAVVLLVLHFAFAVGGKFTESTTSDEIVHVTAGMSYWQNHDYRLHPENGILPQRWAAIPAWLEGAKFPELAGNDYWRTSDAWVVGHQFFYETGEDHFPRLMAGRAMIALFSVGTGALVFLWSRRLFGDAGGLVSLGFFVFSTDFLAHGALTTSDVCMAFFFLAATGAWWWQLHDGRARVWWLSALATGFAFVAKFSAPLLLPIMVATAAARALAPAPLVFGGRSFERPWAKFAAAMVSAAGHGVVVVAVIWLCYGFRYTAFNPALPAADQFIRSWEFMEREIGAWGPFIHTLRDLQVLPEAFLYGFAYVIQTVSSRSAFLNGEYSLTGWPSFFLWTFFFKTSVPAMIASVLVIGLAARRWLTRAGSWSRDLYRLAPLLALFAVYWLNSVTIKLNIGHRHILPIYPVLFIGLGALGLWLRRLTRESRVVVVGLLGWHAAAALWIAPHYLAYFNPIAGGPQNGWRHLVDSSLDWGQDLPGLKRWLEANAKDTPVYLSYFGTGEPIYYGIHARRLPFANNFKYETNYVKLEAGIYCVSATMLQHVYSPVRGATWTLELEKEYQELRLVEPMFERYRDPAERPKLERDLPAAQWQFALRRFDALRFARLCHYLRVRKPEADIGHSIFVHRLTGAEVQAATAGSLREWQALIEQAVASP